MISTCSSECLCTLCGTGFGTVCGLVCGDSVCGEPVSTVAGSGDPSHIGNLQPPPLTWLPSRRSLLSLQVAPWPLCGCCGAIFGSQSQLQLDDQDFLMRLSVDSAVMFGPGTAQLLQQARDSHGVAQEITSGLLRRSAIRRELRSSTHQVASKVPA